MTTLLEFAMRKYLGPPTRVAGEDRWVCRRCGRRKRHARPHKPPHKDTFGCWGCNAFGDIYDVLREAGLSLPDRFTTAVELGEEYERLGLGRVDGDPRFSVPATAAEQSARQVARLLGAIWGLTLRAEGRSPEYVDAARRSLADATPDDR